jgi:hypothetical protein
MTRVFGQSRSHTSYMLTKTYSEVAAGTSTFGNDIADLIGEILLASDAGDCLLDVEFDRRHYCELMYKGCTTEEESSSNQMAGPRLTNTRDTDRGRQAASSALGLPIGEPR